MFCLLVPVDDEFDFLFCVCLHKRRIHANPVLYAQADSGEPSECFL